MKLRLNGVSGKCFCTSANDPHPDNPHTRGTSLGAPLVQVDSERRAHPSPSSSECRPVPVGEHAHGGTGQLGLAGDPSPQDEDVVLVGHVSRQRPPPRRPPAARHRLGSPAEHLLQVLAFAFLVVRAVRVDPSQVLDDAGDPLSPCLRQGIGRAGNDDVAQLGEDGVVHPVAVASVSGLQVSAGASSRLLAAASASNHNRRWSTW